MNRTLLAGAMLVAGIFNVVSAALPRTTHLLVDFPFTRIPRHLWVRELVWLHNIGIHAIVAPNATPELSELASEAGIEIEQPGPRSLSISALDPTALLKSRQAIHTRRQVVWTDVESQVLPIYKRGAVSLEGNEDPSLQLLRREALIWNYWPDVLTTESAEEQPIPGLELAEQRSTPLASAVYLLNTSPKPWHGAVTVGIGSVGRKVQIPDVTVPARDSLLLPVDVTFNNAALCRFCTGMSNSERLLYATLELTNIEYENGILSFEFYAPVPGFAVLQLERQPEGPMLSAGHPTAFDWDPDSKRARLPIPAGSGPGKRVRIAIAMTAPDNVASFVDAHVLVVGQTNRIVTEYAPPEIASRSRLILPDGWKAAGTAKPGRVEYAVEVPSTRLHGDHAELRIETDGLTISHTRVQLLRPISIHVAEAESIHFGSAAELRSDPPLIPVESPTGRNIAVQLRNNAPEIRTFQVELSGEGLEFSPPKTEISIGASMEREVSVRVFTKDAAPGIHDAKIMVTGAASQVKPVRFVVLPRGVSSTYKADLLDAGPPLTIYENSRIRAIFSQEGRWLEFYWKANGKSLLPPEGIAIEGPVKIDLQGDKLTITGAHPVAVPAVPE